MKKRMLAVFIVISAVFCFLDVHEAKALSCAMTLPPAEALELGGGAVYGEVKSIRENMRQPGFTGTKEYERNVLIEVERSWGVETDSQVIIATDFTWGYDFDKGSRYLVFFGVDQDEGTFSSSPCSPTEEMGSLEEASALLGEGMEPGRNVQLGYRMWLMTTYDFDRLIVGGSALAVLTFVLLLVRRIRRRRRQKR